MQMDDVEEMAKRIVKAAMPSLVLQFNVDQSTSKADFLVSENREVVGVLEATRSTIQDQEELRQLIHRNPFLERTQCESDWYIHVGEGSRINELRKRVDHYLREIELSGVERFFSPTDSRIEAVGKIWQDLGVEAGSKIEWKSPGIGMSGPSSGGCAEMEAVWDAVRPEAYKSDNLQKLSPDFGSQRHLFVLIDGLQGAAYVSIEHCEPPKEAPELPPEITHLWVAAEKGPIVYVWLADSEGWRNLTGSIN